MYNCATVRQILMVSCICPNVERLGKSSYKKNPAEGGIDEEFVCCLLVADCSCTILSIQVKQ